MSKAARRARIERQEARPALLAALGTRVRELREAHGQTRRELSAASGLSERFLADLEAGEGNISLQRLDELGRALGTTSVALLSRAQPEETAAPE
ncbi:MAG TPA: helix-turn-helix domain-containing protein, partial [Myxococcales bacterium]|nr:helix-turn-helix domain-containing protein [Myxococcales bacterium]